MNSSKVSRCHSPSSIDTVSIVSSGSAAPRVDSLIFSKQAIESSMVLVLKIARYFLERFKLLSSVLA
ncbi:hypothetical protein [Microcystis phage vB_MaeS-yong1]|nr:hypothetical protein [Microcystis phage vB_MaeS-yong1]